MKKIIIIIEKYLYFINILYLIHYKKNKKLFD